MQGEGGFYAASPAFMQRLRALCDEHGIMLIADEVQSGAGRTGTLFAMEQMGVAADITTFAKSIAGGFPLAGVTGRAEVMDAIAPADWAAPTPATPSPRRRPAVLQISSRRICWKSQPARRHPAPGLLAIAEDHPEIGDVRGLGAMIAIELFEEGDRSRPNAADGGYRRPRPRQRPDPALLRAVLQRAAHPRAADHRRGADRAGAQDHRRLL